MIIYGINPVLEAIKSGRAKEIWVAQRADDRLQRLLEEAGRHSVRIRYVTRDELDHAAKKGAHQGVAADVVRRTESTLEELAGGKDGAPLIVVLDEVEDPQSVVPRHSRAPPRKRRPDPSTACRSPTWSTLRDHSTNSTRQASGPWASTPNQNWPTMNVISPLQQRL